MSVIPPADALAAIESGESRITRRIEIYEADGETPWRPAADEEVIRRLIDGSVSIDASRPERRMMDVTLFNSDKLLRPNPRGGFWYDKVLKVYRGVHYAVPQARPLIQVIEAQDNPSAQKFAAFLRSRGFTRTSVNLSNYTPAYTDQADILVSYSQFDQTNFFNQLTRHFDGGKSVLTISVGNDESTIPHITLTDFNGSGNEWGVTPVTTDTPLSGQFQEGVTLVEASGLIPLELSETAQAIGLWSSGGRGTGQSYISASLDQNNAGGRWVNIQVPDVLDSPDLKNLVQAAISWLHHYSPFADWETQLGEFVIDGISDQRFPGHIKVTTRDYTKRCILSKLTRDVIFPAGTSISEMIRSLARNSGILGNMNVPEVGKYLNQPLSYASNTSRWDIMKSAANGIGQDLFFDQFGDLTMVPLPDTVLNPATLLFQTGPQGNLVDYDRATNDSNLFNHIAVYGSTAVNGVPYFGEAINTDPNSPTRVSKIGDRYYPYNLDTVGSNVEAAQIATNFLKVSALETYELNFSSICYPWVEVNTVARILDPDAAAWEPDKYLVDTAGIPLGLGPMTMTGKRITQVGEPN